MPPKQKLKTLVKAALAAFAAGSVFPGFFYFYSARQVNEPATPSPREAYLELSPLEWNFGRIQVEKQKETTISLKNSGGSNLEIYKIFIFGANTDQFQESHDCPSKLKPQEACSIKVTFKPTYPGVKYASLNVSSSSPYGKSMAPLTGRGGGNGGNGGGGGGGGGGQTGEKPDLVIPYVHHGTSTSNNSTVHMKIYLKNQGSVASGPFVVRGKQNNLKDMYSVSAPSIAAGQQISIRVPYTISCSTHQTLYFYHYADADNQVDESNEANNLRISATTCAR